jgi:hypothetical protein
VVSELTTGLCGNLLRLAAFDRGGDLAHTGALARAGRGALVVDLLRSGAVRSGPTGYEPGPELPVSPGARTLARALTGEPGGRIVPVLQRGRPTFAAMAAELVEATLWFPDGGWRGHRRYLDTEPDGLASLLEAVHDAAVGRPVPMDAAGVAFAALAMTLGLAALTPPGRADRVTRVRRRDRLEALTVAAGPYEAIVRVVVGMNLNLTAGSHATTTGGP